MEFSIHFPFILKKKVDFWMKKERWKLYLFIEDIAFKSNNFSKFLSVNLLIPWCISWDAFTRLANNTLRGDATNTTNANCLLAGLTYTYSLQPATSPKEMRQNYCKITSEKWIENELKKNDSFSNEWWIELIHLFSKWMVNWIDSLFFEMNGELNDSPKNGEWTQVCVEIKSEKIVCIRKVVSCTPSSHFFYIF